MVDGLEMRAVLVEELEEFGGVGIGREELAGGHAVYEAVAAGDGFALGGARAGTFVGVLAIGVHLRFGGHGMGPFCVMVRHGRRKFGSGYGMGPSLPIPLWGRGFW